MDLSIRDVAELLNVSEDEIHQLVKAREIPAYHINNQVRFNCLEIDQWVMEQKVGKKKTNLSFNKSSQMHTQVTTETNQSRTGQQQFSLYRALHKGFVYQSIEGNTKEDILRNTTLEVAKHLDLDADVLAELLLDRERLMPTSLNQGLAVPHTRDFLLNEQHDIVLVVYPQKPIPYGALDGIPVHTLFFLFACQEKRHLHLLAKLAHLASQEETRKLLLQRANKPQLLEHVKQWESGLAAKEH